MICVFNILFEKTSLLQGHKDILLYFPLFHAFIVCYLQRETFPIQPCGGGEAPFHTREADKSLLSSLSLPEWAGLPLSEGVQRVSFLSFC